MALQRGSQGCGRKASGSSTSAFPSPSPLGQNSNARAPTHPSGSFTPCMPLTVELDDYSPSIKKRWWTSSVWKYYNIKEGKHFPNGKDNAYYEDDQEVNGVCAQFSKVILNVDEDEVEEDEEKEEEVGLESGDQTEFDDSNIN